VTVTGPRRLEELKPGRLRLSAALGLYRVRLRKRWIQELLAVLGIATGVALLYATQVASTSLSSPVRQLNAGIVGHSQLQLLGRSQSGFPEATYTEVVRRPGVVRAAPVLQLPGDLVGPRGRSGVTFLGADPRIVKLKGELLQGFNSADVARQETIVIPTPVARAIGVKVGDDARVEIAGRSTTLPIVVADRDQIGSMVDASIALVPLAYLQRLAHTGRVVTRMLVEAEPGRIEEVRRNLGTIGGPRQLDVQSTDYDTELFNQAAKPWRQSSTIFSVLSALVGWLFAVCALLVTAAERRSLAAEQRDQGFPPSATMLTLLVDAAIIGIAGVVLGLAAGEALSREGFESDVSFLSGAFPIGDQRVVTWESVALAAAGGLLAAVVGVLAPLGQVVAGSVPSRMRRLLSPRAARPDRPDDPPSRTPSFLGGAALLAAVVITVAAPGAAVVGLLILGIALVLLLPALLRAAIAVLEWVNSRGRASVAVVLALQQLKSRRWQARALAITATGAIAVFGATSLQGARTNLQAGLDSVTRDLSGAAAIWASPTGAGSVFGTNEFTPTATRALAALPGVRDVRLYRAGLVDIAGRRVWLIGQPPEIRRPVPSGLVLEGDGDAASARVRAGGWAVVSRDLAEHLHLRLGQAFVLPAPRPTTLRVAAIMSNLGWSGGAVLTNARDVARAYGGRAIAAYHVDLARGVSSEDGRRQVAQALGAQAALRVETAAHRADRQQTASRGGLSRLRQIAQLTLLAAVLAMGAAMTGLLWQHRPIVGELKLDGLTTNVMWRSLLVETAVLFGVGAVAGGAFGLLGQVLCTRGLEVVTGFPVVGGLRLGTAVATVGVVVGASLLAVFVPGRLVARARPSWHD
jgi:putative ABC transport system permease protein